MDDANDRTAPETPGTAPRRTVLGTLALAIGGLAALAGVGPAAAKDKDKDNGGKGKGGKTQGNADGQPNGNPGDNGPAGSGGVSAAKKGKPGPTGPTGPAAGVSVTGPTGPAGPGGAGSPGPGGPAGPQGAVGPVGPQGIPGPASGAFLGSFAVRNGADVPAGNQASFVATCTPTPGERVVATGGGYSATATIVNNVAEGFLVVFNERTSDTAWQVIAINNSNFTNFLEAQVVCARYSQ